MSLTTTQQQAVQARGNVLVMAGAGTGKTRTLVERCLHCLLDEAPRVSLDEILVVTFTEAAAAEMRHRLRARLEQEATANPADSHWDEQLALFETAHIGTLHSFCFKLVRQHFYELELDPQVSVLPEEEARLLAEETLHDLLQRSYEGKGSQAQAVQQLIQTQAKGSDQQIRNLVLKLHHYTQTLPDPELWFDQQTARFANPDPETWRAWYLDAVAEWIQQSLPVFQTHAPYNPVAAACHAAVKAASRRVSSSVAASVLAAVNEAANACPQREKKARLEPLQPFIDEAVFLGSLSGTGAGSEPIVEDWTWARGSMASLLALARDFVTAFARAKRELGGVDFHDLEQHALRLLWDRQTNRPTPIAHHWRRRLRFVLVDEYQDINAAQDTILRGLSREPPEANLFLVGDVKQSIYRFRLANPRIFQNYASRWGTESGSRTGGSQVSRARSGQVIPLIENFRSRQGILCFINLVFEQTMHADLGGVKYDEAARLVFGAPDARDPLADKPGSPPPVELHIRIKESHPASASDAENAEALDQVGELEEAAKEARLIALRLRSLKAEAHPVWDEKLGGFRPVDWCDMAVLLRAPARKAESFAQEFARLEVPVQVERGGFYSSPEVSDLLSLLQVLDNPLQDLPLLAVLRSPLVGLSLDQLAEIRLVALRAPFWKALVQWHELHGPRLQTAVPTQAAQPSAEFNQVDKVSAFLPRFHRWRRLARQVSLSRCLESILAETHYLSWLRFQPRGEQRRGNVHRLVALAQHFDKLQRQGLFRFLRFIDAQQRAGTEPEVASVSGENAVRLLSIHQSKGLEFPVVVAADLAKPFNTQDLRAEILLDEEFGLCPQVAPPQIRKRYPSLAHWLASRRQKRELLGEELRLLYVAMTRARDLLILTCSLSRKNYQDNWRGEPPPHSEARSCADWLALGLGKFLPQADSPGRQTVFLPGSSNDSCRLRWFLHDDSSLVRAETQPAPAKTAPDRQLVVPETNWAEVRRRLSWEYPFTSATRQPAKTTVSALRRSMVDAELSFAAGALPGMNLRQGLPGAARGIARASTSGLDVGTAHHTFLQFVALESTQSPSLLRQEAQRLETQGLLTPEQVRLLDFESLAEFWRSALGRSICAQAQFVHRELPFTFRLSPEQLSTLAGEAGSATVQDHSALRAEGEDEFIVIQGVADLAVLMPTEIWLLDFKTDKVPNNAPLPAEKYAAQLKLYANALHLVYARPVTQCWLWFLTAGRGVQIRAEF